MKTKINWLEWSKESFGKAKQKDKPILLDLTAVWCHWCHVMDATSYSDVEIIRKINEDFIPIKVDIDKRPDIKERYNMGGFPSTVFLNPDGYIIAGETYVAPERMKLLLDTVKTEYDARKDDARRIISETAKDLQATNTPISPDYGSITKEILLSIEDNFDDYGGFGLEPKFPTPEIIDFLFRIYKKTKEKKYLDMAMKTLEGMSNGLFDKVDGGFFRYSVTRDWKLPHYEKMLETNAGLIRNYAEGYEATENEEYKGIALGTMRFVRNFLSNKGSGGFYGSMDANEEFYRLGAEDRKKMGYPMVDKTIYVDWNSMMVSSYIKAGAIFGDREAVEFAIKTADFILDNCYKEGDGLFDYFDGKPNVSGLLNDNICFLDCLIDVYSAMPNKKYISAIKEIAEFILKSFHDSKDYGFYDRIQKGEDLGALSRKKKQFLDNSYCAIVFLKAYILTKNPAYKSAAENALANFADKYPDYGCFSAVYGTAAYMLLNEINKAD